VVQVSAKIQLNFWDMNLWNYQFESQVATRNRLHFLGLLAAVDRVTNEKNVYDKIPLINVLHCHLCSCKILIKTVVFSLVKSVICQENRKDCSILFAQLACSGINAASFLESGTQWIHCRMKPIMEYRIDAFSYFCNH